MRVMPILGAAAMLIASCAPANKCQPLEPGLAALEIKAVAESKSGASPIDSDAYGTSSPTGRFELLDYDNIQGLVVWVEPTDHSAAAQTNGGEVRVEFDEHGQGGGGVVQGVAVGTRLIVVNRSEKPQSLYCVSDGNEAESRTVAPGAQTEFAVRSPGMIEIVSESMDEPAARVYAVASRWVRTLHAGESTCFNDLPPGGYRAVCWHERLPGSQQPVTLAAGTHSQITLTASVNLLPVHP
jgi:hypothetical protein